MAVNLLRKKITESLTDICEYYGFKRAFIYQTDGFRYFYLKETVGNSDNILRQRFEISEMTNQHAARKWKEQTFLCLQKPKYFLE